VYVVLAVAEPVVKVYVVLAPVDVVEAEAVVEAPVVVPEAVPEAGEEVDPDVEDVQAWMPGEPDGTHELPDVDDVDAAVQM